VYLWEAGLLACLVSTCVLLLLIGERLTGRLDIAMLAGAVLMSMPGFRGGLAWTPFPSAEFTTGTLAGVLGLYVVWCLVRGKWLPAGITAGLLFNIHPSMGSISAALFVAVALVEPEHRARQMRSLAWLVLLASPNVVAMAAHLFGGSGASPLLADIAVYQRQHTLRNFWGPEVPFYAVMLAMAMAGTGAVDELLCRRVRAVIIAVQVLMGAYIVGVDVLQSTAVAVFFMFRASAFIKILAVIFAAALALNQSVATPRWRRAALVGLLVAAAFVQNELGSLACALLALAVFAAERRSHRAVPFSLALVALAVMVSVGWRRLGIPPASPHTVGILIGVATVAALLSLPSLLGVATDALPARRPLQWRAVALVVALIPVVSSLLQHPYDWTWRQLRPLSPAAHIDRIQFDRPAGALAAMERWVRDSLPHAALVVVPPSRDDASAFRLRARRGVFISASDMAQLTYSPAAYPEAARRMALAQQYLGTGGVGCAGLDSRAAGLFRSAGATHVVCRGDDPAPLRRVYADPAWALYAF
jgi:hypothetical protein